MLTSLNHLPIFVRVTGAFTIITLIAAVAISLLSADYYQALLARDQAVKTSFSAQQTANAQQVNLQRMNAILQTRFAQVFATTAGGTIHDPALQASGALTTVDILTREDDFDQTLESYQQNFALATSPAMSGVRAIVLSDDPNTTISRTQLQALSLVAREEWPSYKVLQDRELQALDAHLNPTLTTNPHLAYIQAYTILFEANQHFLALKLDWQRVVNSAETMGEIVTTVGPSQTQPALVSTATALLLTILLIILIGSLVNRSITFPLRQLAALTRRIGRGEMQARAPVRGQDEIALVASSMNTMLDQIVHLIQEAQGRHARLQFQVEKLMHEVSGVGSGNLRIQARVDAAELGVLADAINYMVEALSSLVLRVKSVAQDVARETVQIAQVMSHLVESDRHQIAQISAASRDIERMAATSQQVAQRAHDLSALAGQARAIATEGAASVQQTVEGMGRINAQVQATAHKVQVLEQRSQVVNEIGTFMGGIALKTNRLALDAAIQAKMAGENGSAFAAVADDIRRLAEQAKTQASSIEGMVRTVRGDIAEVQRAMSETTHETERGAQLAQRAGMALASIFAAVERQADEIMIFNQVALEQVQVSAAVVQIMQQVSASTKLSGAHTQQAARSLHHEGQLVAQLRASVEVFRVREAQQPADPRAVVVQAGPENQRGRDGTFSPSSGLLPTGNPPARLGVRPAPEKCSVSHPTWQHPSSE